MTGQHWVERWALRTRPDLVIANSRYTAALARSAFPGVPVSVWYLPVAPAAVKASRSDVRGEFGTSSDAVVILQVSRLDAFKGHTVLIDALRRLDGSCKWECWVVGGAQQAREKKYLCALRDAVCRGGLDQKVRFLGQRKDVARLLCAADIFCQPNTGPEPFGIAIVEALYGGLPVVTSGFGGAAEIVSEDCGVVLRPGDAAGLADVLASLMRDPERRRKLGAAGPARARQLCEPARQLSGFAQHLSQDHHPPFSF
jgi:glycosyltransferase involved in cell wall biosynthesis